MGYTAIRKMNEKNNNERFTGIPGKKGPAVPCFPDKKKEDLDLASAAASFLHNRCEDLRFSEEIEEEEKTSGYLGRSIGKNMIPYNMQMDIDRLCLANALDRFIDAGTAQTAFDVYFCYLEMFVGAYGRSRRMIELLSEFESNSSSLLMKHRDHYAHSVYVFALGLAIYETNEEYRRAYKDMYGCTVKHKDREDQELAHHFLRYWGLASLFHDIGYPFELPFEQIEAYFEDREKNEKGIKKIERGTLPFISFSRLEQYTALGSDRVRAAVKEIYPEGEFDDIRDILAWGIVKRLGGKYDSRMEKICRKMSENSSCEDFKEWKDSVDYLKKVLCKKPESPDSFNYFMDHAVFSAVVLARELFAMDQGDQKINESMLDALTAIAMHNSLYKFSIADWKKEGNTPFAVKDHPLAFMLMLCDELQCWDRTSYGRESRSQLHPMACEFSFKDGIEACYLYDEGESSKIIDFWKKHDRYVQELQANPKTADDKNKKPAMKAYSTMVDDNEFLSDIKKIVDLSDIPLTVDTRVVKKDNSCKNTYLSQGKFLHLYNFGAALNARWKGKADSEQMDVWFDELSLEYKLSNIAQARKFAEHLDKIGCFYTDQPVDLEMVDAFTEKELVLIGEEEHRRWEDEKKSMYWMPTGSMSELCRDKYIREQTRMHNDFDTNFFLLDDEAKAKDMKPMNTMVEKLKEYDGLRIYRYIRRS